MRASGASETPPPRDAATGGGDRASRFSLPARVRSFAYALSGLFFMLRTQHNAWLHAAATGLVVVLGFSLGVSADDWKWLTLTIVVVWSAEAMNTAFEHLCDAVRPEFHPSVKRAKDVAAGAVLIAAIGAAIIAALVFGPHFLRLAAD